MLRCSVISHCFLLDPWSWSQDKVLYSACLSNHYQRATWLALHIIGALDVLIDGLSVRGIFLRLEGQSTFYVLWQVIRRAIPPSSTLLTVTILSKVPKPSTRSNSKYYTLFSNVTNNRSCHLNPIDTLQFEIWARSGRPLFREGIATPVRTDSS